MIPSEIRMILNDYCKDLNNNYEFMLKEETNSAIFRRWSKFKFNQTIAY